ncbi:MAG: urea transporter [Cyanobacteria bacterium SZAS TMP-1]|nr:urea transporter [Cyanobacteria bacterium SZAS TMP-1]
MNESMRKVFDGYGSFFGLSHPLSRFLLVICTMLHPLTGLGGIECAVMVLVWRKLLSFPSDGVLEIVNGLLFGMLIGSLYQPGAAQALVVAIGALFIVLITVCLQDTLGRIWRLPVLGLPYVLTGYLFLPIAAHLGLAPLVLTPQGQLSILHMIAPPFIPLDSPLNLFAPLGSLYFNGTPIGGMLVFIAFALSSRYLALLTLAAGATCAVFLYYSQGPVYSQTSIFTVLPLPLLIAQMNGILTAGVIGGLYAVPSPRSIVVALGSALMACLLTLFMQHSFLSATLPPLALPFVLSIYITVLGLGANRGGPWLRFWLLAPALPEQSLERLTVAKARGIDLHSVALASPVTGVWTVYQGFDGAHTHQGPWRYALDLIQTKNEKSFANDGSVLTDYYAYGKAVLSPGWGTVVRLNGSCNDNKPGELDLINNWGNYIIIALDSGACVMLAHLQKSSTRVSLHQRVAPGQMVALCGNSGRSPQPHLHIHVQNTAEPGAPTVPFHLCPVQVGQAAGEVYQLNAVPREGETISATARNAALARALRLKVGHCFDYDVTTANQSSRRQLAVQVDIGGQFYLESQYSNKKNIRPRVAFSASEDLVAFFERNSQADPFLDAYVLALGLTPLAEGNLTWSDKVPLDMLPTSTFAKWFWTLLHPFSPCIDSSYTRHWDPAEMLWIQKGVHRLPLPGPFKGLEWKTEAQLSELSGVLAIALKDGTGNKLLTARLDGYSLRADNGIPEMILSHQ